MATENTDSIDPTAEPVVDPNASDPKPIDLKDDQLVEVVWNGQKVVKPWKEAKANIQMQEDYTRGKQALAKQAKELKDLYDGLTAKQKELLEKETAIDSILGRNKPKDKADEIAPDEVLTFAQAQKLLRQEREEMQKTFDSRLQEQETKATQKAAYQRWEDLTTRTTKELVKEHPLLEDVPHLDMVLKQEALKSQPTTEDELVQALVKAGKDVAGKFEKRYLDRRKDETVRKRQLTEKGPEATRGEPLFAAPKKTYGTGRKIDWNELDKDVSALLNGLED